MMHLRPLRSQSLFQFVQIRDEYSEHLLLQYSLHFVINLSDSGHSLGGVIADA